MKRRDARRQRGERRRVPVAVDREDRARPIADEQRAVGRERQPAGDAEIGGERLGRPVRRARDRPCPRTGSTRRAGRRRSIAIDVGLTMPDEKRFARAVRAARGRSRPAPAGRACRCRSRRGCRRDRTPGCRPDEGRSRTAPPTSTNAGRRRRRRRCAPARGRRRRCRTGRATSMRVGEA